MTRFVVRIVSFFAAVVMVVALLLLAKTTQNTAEFSNLHYYIVLLNAAGMLLLLVLIFVNVVRLVRDHIKGIPGARLKSRMISMFAMLAAVPLILVYLFSMYFLNRGINSYFDTNVTQGLDDALTLSQTVLDLRMREHMSLLELLTKDVASMSELELVSEAEPMRRQLQAAELVFIGDANRILAATSDFSTSMMPQTLSDRLLAQVRSGLPVLDIEPTSSGGLQIRAARLVSDNSLLSENRVVYALFPVADSIGALADSVEQTYSHHNNLEYLREPLIDSFKLTLTLVLLVTLFMTLWGIFFLARRIVKPIQDLVAGTQAVAAGDFHMQLPEAKKDDIGFLVASFNNMTRRLSRTNEIEKRSLAAVEAERSNLETILSSLSSGVIAIEPDLTIRSVNEAACAILHVDPVSLVGKPLQALESDNDMVIQLADVCYQRLSNDKFQWREQIAMHGQIGQRILSCAATPLPKGEDDLPLGYVIVFDDVTTVLQAQREAAWGEVARRLAHEIKNPLTPIQLSAERMRRKYLGQMTAYEADVLERSTRTIVQQVETMRDMVDAFRDYARAPDIDLTRFNLNTLVSEMVDLYRGDDTGVQMNLELDESLTEIVADSGRLRQIFHNLLRNSVEALGEKLGGRIIVKTLAATYKKQDVAKIVFEDNGPGFQETMLRTVFEPYVTSKPKGTGLGLAIVKKLVEEHAGVINIENIESGGAQITLVLPLHNDSRMALMSDLAVEEPKKETA